MGCGDIENEQKLETLSFTGFLNGDEGRPVFTIDGKLYDRDQAIDTIDNADMDFYRSQVGTILDMLAAYFKVYGKLADCELKEDGQVVIVHYGC